jgi:hypothetical protein
MCLNRIRLECVVQFNAPSVIGVFGAAGSFSSEVVVSVQFNVLLESYACTSYPEMNIGVFIEAILQLVGEVQSGVTEEDRACISLYIVCTQLPGTWFIGINCAIGETCGPQSCVFGAVLSILCLYIVTIKGEVAVTKTDGSASAPGGEVFAFVNIIIAIAAIQIESRNISAVSYMAGQFCKPVFSLALCSISFSDFVIAILPSIFSGLQITIACIDTDLAIVPASGDAIILSIFIPECTGLVKSYAETAEVNGGFIVRSPLCIDTIHGGIAGVFVFEVHFIDETSIDSYLVINVSLYIKTDTAIPGIIISSFACFSIQVVLVLHTSIAGPVEVADFLFQVAYANAQVSQFVSVFASQFIKGCTLFSVQLVFFSHEAGDDLSQFVTGHVPFTFEGAVRIAFYDALVGEVGYCLVSPVIRCNIRERISCVCGYASGECCYCSDCENLFHVLRSF